MTVELKCAECGQRIVVEDNHDSVEETEDRVIFRLSASPPPCSACGKWAWLKVVPEDVRNQEDDDAT